MKLYDLLQFSVCVFSILAAGSWLQSATKGNGRPSRPCSSTRGGGDAAGSPRADAVGGTVKRSKRK